MESERLCVCPAYSSPDTTPFGQSKRSSSAAHREDHGWEVTLTLWWLLRWASPDQHLRAPSSVQAPSSLTGITCGVSASRAGAVVFHGNARVLAPSCKRMWTGRNTRSSLSAPLLRMLLES